MELNDILLLLEKFEVSDLSSLKVKLKGDEFHASRAGGEEPAAYVTERIPGPVKKASPEPAASEQAEKIPADTPEEDLYQVVSPIVGTFYAAPSEEDAPYVKVGDRVSKGDILCILEAMKIMNEIRSPITGVIRKVMLENKDLADFGKVLFLIKEEPHA